jgi:protein-disulfide isomerase
MTGGWSRRDAIVSGVCATAVAGGLGAVLVRRSRGDAPEFRAMTRPVGYRWLVQAGGGVSSAGAALAGIGEAPPQAPIGDLCAALFHDARAQGAAPIAVFTDYRCAYCKLLTKRLLDLAEAEPARVRLHVHEWPALGPVSERMARIALAARAQGDWRGMHDLLSATPFMPSDAWIVQSAEKLSLSATQILRDMHGPDTTRDLVESAALAALFGFEGTPGVVIGRNVAAGALSEEMLRILVGDAQRSGPPPRCG